MSRKWNFLSLALLVLVICFFGDDYIEYVPGTGALTIDSGDTSWMVVASAFVLLMTPGLAFFYGGMVDKKNVISTMLQSFVALGVISVLWITVGFSLCFGESIGGIIGNPLTYFAFNGVGLAPIPSPFLCLPCTRAGPSPLSLPATRMCAAPGTQPSGLITQAGASWCATRIRAACVVARGRSGCSRVVS